jgi:hypothetical protein
MDEVVELDSTPTLPSSATDAGFFTPLDDTPPDEEYTAYEDYLEDLKDKIGDYF